MEQELSENQLFISDFKVVDQQSFIFDVHRISFHGYVLP